MWAVLVRNLSDELDSIGGAMQLSQERGPVRYQEDQDGVASWRVEQRRGEMRADMQLRGECTGLHNYNKAHLLARDLHRFWHFSRSNCSWCASSSLMLSPAFIDSTFAHLRELAQALPILKRDELLICVFYHTEGLHALLYLLQKRSELRHLEHHASQLQSIFSRYNFLNSLDIAPNLEGMRSASLPC